MGGVSEEREEEGVEWCWWREWLGEEGEGPEMRVDVVRTGEKEAGLCSLIRCTPRVRFIESRESFCVLFVRPESIVEACELAHNRTDERNAPFKPVLPRHVAGG